MCLGGGKAKPTTWIFTSKACSSGQGMTLEETLWFSVEASRCVNTYPDKHSTFGMGCHLEIITKHRLAHGISCTSCLTWEQPVPHPWAAPAPQHVSHRQKRHSKCLHTVSCLFLLPFWIIPLSQGSSTVIPLLAFCEECPSCWNREMLHARAHSPQGLRQFSELLAKAWNQMEWRGLGFHVFFFF